MSLNFLMILSAHGFPFRTTDQGEIAHIDILNVANLIVATVPSEQHRAYVGEAIVHSFTESGLELAGSLGREKPRKMRAVSSVSWESPPRS